jgi:two-component system, cell cycle sensor histidine kinase and response regulator CckA
VFEPFYTTKSPGQGTGLGLAVVWNVVKNLDGWIEIDSRPGEGTSFHVYFPVPEVRTPAPAPVPATPATAAGKGLNILLVDDNVFVAETINRLLAREGHRVTYAQNGEEALALCAGGKAEAYDLILTDQNMPVMTGVEFVRALRQAGSPVRVIVVSGHLSAELTKELDSLGVNSLLAKPFTQKELLAAVGRSINAPRARPRPSAG